jgi:alkyl sulfatase BDS1-like metallo-beta-lactamase superfamily hydrolase
MNSGNVKLTGDASKLEELLGYLDNVSKSFWFNMVTP